MPTHHPTTTDPDDLAVLETTARPDITDPEDYEPTEDHEPTEDNGPTEEATDSKSGTRTEDDTAAASRDASDCAPSGNTRPAPRPSSGRTPAGTTPPAGTTAPATVDTDAAASTVDVVPDQPGADGPEPPAQATLPDALDPMGAAVQDRVWGVLRVHPDTTPTELARAARVSRATVTALLDGWAAEGSATGTPGPTARSARRWTAVPSVPDLRPVADAIVDPPEVPDAQADADAVDRVPSASTPVAARQVNGSGSARLGSGALQGLVEEFLTENSGAHGPVAIAKAIGRSSGAVANALERLVGSGWALRTSDKPKRYRIADAPDATGDAPDATADAPDAAAVADEAGAVQVVIAADDGSGVPATATPTATRKGGRARRTSTPS